MTMKTFATPLVALILATCAAGPTSEHSEMWASEAKRPGTPKLELICNDTCRLDYRGDNTLSIPLDSCSEENELCLWHDDFINLYVPPGDTPTWSFRGRDYECEPDGDYDIIEERQNGALTKTYFVFEDRMWMVIHSNRHDWTGDDGRGVAHSNAHSDSLLFVIHF